MCVCVYIHHNSAGCASSSHVCLICVDAHPSKGPNPPPPKNGREGGGGVTGPKKRKIGGRTDGPRGVLNIKADAETREREKTIEALLLLLLPLIFFFPLPPSMSRSFCPRFFQFRSGSVRRRPVAAAAAAATTSVSFSLLHRHTLMWWRKKI